MPASTRHPAQHRIRRTVLFVDIVGSTALLSRLGDAEYRDRRDDFLALVHSFVASRGGQLVNTAGDETFSVFPGPGAAIECARAICTRAQRDLALTVRTGVHTGELLSTGTDFVGMTVHIGARIAKLARGGEVLVSRAVRDLTVTSGSRFTPRGRHVLKGVPGDSELFALEEPARTGGAQRLHAPAACACTLRQ